MYVQYVLLGSAWKVGRIFIHIWYSRVQSILSRRENRIIEIGKYVPFQKMGPKRRDWGLLEESYSKSDYISVIYRENIPTQNSTGGIFRKIMVSDLGAQTLNSCFLETGLTGHADFTVFSNQHWLSKQQSISFPRQRIQGESHMRMCVHWVCTGTKREPSFWEYNRTTLFLGDINTGSCPSRLGESRIWHRKMWSWVPRDSDLRLTEGQQQL
jgi:hypothetical protein